MITEQEKTTDTPPRPKPSQERMIALGEIRPSKTNPRKTFTPEELKNLQESIAAVGLLQSLVVRPIADKADKAHGYELVAGERRFRCCTALKLAEVRCVVVVLSDLQAMEIQIIENLLREDVNPIEEAEGYEALLKAGSYDAKTLAAKLHKTPRYIYQRLKLTALPEPARLAVLDGKLPLGAARLIACLPHKEWREEATKGVLEPTKHEKLFEDTEIETYDLKGALTAQQTDQFLQARYMRTLNGAPFDPKDAQVLPAAGACTNCPKRAGNSAELFPDLRADMCTDAKCYRSKVQASQDLLSAQARAEGKKVMPAAEVAKQLEKRYTGGYQLRYNSAYVEIEGKPGYDVLASGVNTPPSWKGLVKGKEVPVVIAFDGDGKRHELYERKLAMAAAKENKPAMFRTRESSQGSAEAKKQRLEMERCGKVRDLAFSDFMDELCLKIEKDKIEKGLGLVFGRALIDLAMDRAENFTVETIEAVLRRRQVQIKAEDDSCDLLEKYLKSFGTAQSRAAMAIELLLTCDHLEEMSGGDVAFAKHYKIDLAKLRANANDVMLHAEKVELEKAKQVSRDGAMAAKKAGKKKAGKK